MKRLTLWDALATLLVIAVAIPYVGYLIRGEMPFVEDPRGMAGTGLVLGAAAFLVAWGGRRPRALGFGERTAVFGSLLVGIAAVALAETGVAEAILAVFMATILLAWAVEMLKDAGLVAA